LRTNSRRRFGDRTDPPYLVSDPIGTTLNADLLGDTSGFAHS